jgi:glycerol-3-phosphate dehydrogenase
VKPIVIVGGGVIGCSIANKLADKHKDIFVLEAESRLGQHQSTRNSGVLHAGIYYSDKTKKGKHCVRGNEMHYSFGRQYDVPTKRVGKTMLARYPSQLHSLDNVRAIAEGNGVEVLSLTRSDIKKYEPNADGIAGLHFPSTGIIDCSTLMERLRGLSQSKGVEYICNAKVSNITEKKGKFTVETNRGPLDAEILINSAGLYSDVIANMINPENNYQITPIRGEYAKICNNNLVNGHIYPVPNPDSLGIHITPTFGDYLIVGPTAVHNVGKEAYVTETPVEKFFDAVSYMIPSLKESDLRQEPHVGIRAKLKDHKDWVIERDARYDNCIQLVGLDSPAMTGCHSIAEEVDELVTM